MSDQARQLRRLRDGYGDIGADALLAAIDESQARIARIEATVLHNHDESPSRRAWARRAIDWATEDRDHTQGNIDHFVEALS